MVTESILISGENLRDSMGKLPSETSKPGRGSIPLGIAIEAGFCLK